MPKNKAIAMAKELNSNPHIPGLTYKAAPMHWLSEKGKWYIKVSDKSGIFSNA